MTHNHKCVLYIETKQHRCIMSALPCMRPLLTVNCVLFLDLQCIQRSRLASAGNKISGVLSVDRHKKNYTMKYQLRRQGRDLLLQMSVFRWDCTNLPQESLKGE